MEYTFDYFFKKYHKSLVYYSYSIVKDSGAAEDLVTQVWEVVITGDWISLFNKKYELEADIVFKQWLYISVRNATLNYLKVEKVKRKRETNWYECFQDEIRGGYDVDMMRAEVVRNIHEALMQLPPECRKIMKMYWIDDLSTPQIAKILRLARTTVQNQKTRGEGLLKGIITKEGECTKLGVKKVLKATTERNADPAIVIEMRKRMPPRKIAEILKTTPFAISQILYKSKKRKAL